MPRKQDTESAKERPQSPFLQSSDDWRRWLSHIKSTARSSGIWEYCDPTTERPDLPCLEEPKEPTIRSVKSLAESLADLDLSDFTSLHSLAAKYKAELATYREKRRALDDLSNTIMKSISSEYRPLLQDVQDQPYEQLKILSGIFDRPPLRTLEKLQEEWETIQNVGKSYAVQEYVRRWQNLYQQCVDWNLVLPQGRENAFLRERALYEYLISPFEDAEPCSNLLTFQPCFDSALFSSFLDKEKRPPNRAP
ncbi:Uncharacterized protein PECH_001079 [Penicillium ucsense]|uniref:Uncharacterized protein n=1 Tax=Penicillium ucsense TaxID=2839758 RepID=A0A8J8WAC2_9EURO|nr:Uncharacterized protein PECM_002364 [Penicillium ucsense]KAF7738315.1 Uncharacterized protein PECH_001079 [Penicillium ucsense]